MRGCSIESDVMATNVTGTRGFNATATRLGPGVVRVTLDQPLAPHEYAVTATLTDSGGSIFVRKMLNGSLAQLEVTTTCNGITVDNDFDLSILPFYSRE